MSKFQFSKAIEKARQGYFEFCYDIKIGFNEVRRKHNGRWISDTIEVIPDRRKTFDTEFYKFRVAQ
jgi:hypothetical protein